MEVVKNERTIDIAGIINGETLDQLLRKSRELSSDGTSNWICFNLSTEPGGEPIAGLAAYDYLTSILSINLQTVILGQVDYIGLIIALSGKHRVISANSIVHLQEPDLRLSEGKRYTAVEVRELVQLIEKYKKWMANILVQESGGKLTLKKVYSMMRNYTLLDSKKMFEFGLVQEII